MFPLVGRRRVVGAGSWGSTALRRTVRHRPCLSSESFSSTLCYINSANAYPSIPAMLELRRERFDVAVALISKGLLSAPVADSLFLGRCH